MRTILRYLFVFSFVLAGWNSLLAQATATGNIIGVVTDATGAALPALPLPRPTPARTRNGPQLREQAGNIVSISCPAARTPSESESSGLQPYRGKRHTADCRHDFDRESSYEDRNGFDFS